MAENPYEAAINDLVANIDERMAPILEDQRTVNRLCALAGHPSRYPDVDTPRAGGTRSIKRDQFHGKPLATAVKQYLELRGPSDRSGLGAATVNEIFDALIAGGYKADAADEVNAKRGLRIALTKNSYLFYRVSSDVSDGGSTYGLLEWYPNAKPQKVDDDVAQSSKGKRGRPAKGKKKRGRPPKAPATAKPENVVDLARNAEKGAAPPEAANLEPRKRGRPRKVKEGAAAPVDPAVPEEKNEKAA